MAAIRNAAKCHSCKVSLRYAQPIVDYCLDGRTEAGKIGDRVALEVKHSRDLCRAAHENTGVQCYKNSNRMLDRKD